MGHNFPVALAFAAIIAMLSPSTPTPMYCSAAAFVILPSATGTTRTCGRSNNNHQDRDQDASSRVNMNRSSNYDRRPLENHIYIDVDRPHGYKDPQAQMEMPNNVYIDGEPHAAHIPNKSKNSNEVDPSESYEILGIPNGCADKAKIKKAYYEMVAKYHPDHNKWMNEEEEANAREYLYKINAAFASLRTALQNRPRIRAGFGAAGTSSTGSSWYDDNSYRNDNSYFMP